MYITHINICGGDSMKRKIICEIITAVIILASSFIPCFAQGSDFDYLDLPDEALTEFYPEILARISCGDDHISNRGFDETGLYISPYWSMKVNGSDAPVYATPVYDWALDTGVLSSFQVLFMSEGDSLNVKMDFCGQIKNAVVLPEKLNAKVGVVGNSLRTEIKHTGTYSFLINDDSQEYAVTLFVKENTDEEEEINTLREKYGENNVLVYEKGFYSVSTVPTDADCIYFKRGSFVSFKHEKDIRSAEDAVGHNPSSVMALTNKKGATVSGCGVLDFTKIDRSERNLINVNYCSDTTVEGLICLNPNSWTLTTYASENCLINDIAVFGYRTNSDGINICGSSEMSVTDSFCRNGDDCFSVKATNEYYSCHGITVSDCIGWSNKARCFGITTEVESDIYDIVFSDCAVICRNAIWDMNRTGSLVVAVETGGSKVDNVLFEDIEIYKETGRPIYCMIYSDDISSCSVSNVKFRNINMNASGKIKISSQKELSLWGKICALLNNSCIGKIGFMSDFFSRFYNSTNSVSVSFENVKFNGSRLWTDKSCYFEKFGNTDISFVK